MTALFWIGGAALAWYACGVVSSLSRWSESETRGGWRLPAVRTGQGRAERAWPQRRKDKRK